MAARMSATACRIAGSEEDPSASSIYGARMTGGGFGGCIVALVKTEDVEKVAQELLDSYCQETGIETTYLVTRAGEGARILYQA